MSLDRGVLLRFISLLALQTCWATFQRVPANCHQHGNGERDGARRRTKVSFGRTMMQVLHGAAVEGKKAHLRMRRH